MNRILGILLAVSLLAGPLHAVATQPNIIVFLVDDMGVMDTSLPCLTNDNGEPIRHPLNDWYQTPSMERLAKHGIVFSNFYAHSVCSPTRISYMTGQNSARHRSTNWISPKSNNRTKFGPPEWNWPGLQTGDVTLPLLLKQKGYRTIHVGKAHFGTNGHDGSEPRNLGFDANIGGSAIGHPGSYYGKDGYGHIKGSKTHAVPHLAKYHRTDTHLTEALTLEANAIITQTVENNQPFFLSMAHYAVHAPFQSDPRFATDYEGSEKPEKAKDFATMIEGMDKSLGDILDQVEELGVAENTLVLFLGDNGSDAPLGGPHVHACSAPLRGKKGAHYEGGMRVPFIATWVKREPSNQWQKKLPIAAGAIQTQMGTVLDIFPTLCSLTGVDLPEGHVIDGADLALQLAGKRNNTRSEVFLNHFPHSHRSSYFTSFVDGDWKVIYHYPVAAAPRYELFNLKEDPYEKNDLTSTEPEQLATMMQALITDLESMKALYPVKDGQELKPILPGAGGDL